MACFWQTSKLLREQTLVLTVLTSPLILSCLFPTCNWLAPVIRSSDYIVFSHVLVRWKRRFGADLVNRVLQSPWTLYFQKCWRWLPMQPLQCSILTWWRLVFACWVPKEIILFWHGWLSRSPGLNPIDGNVQEQDQVNRTALWKLWECHVLPKAQVALCHGRDSSCQGRVARFSQSPWRCRRNTSEIAASSFQWFGSH